MRVYQSTVNGLYVLAPKDVCGQAICGPGELPEVLIVPEPEPEV